MRLPWHWASLSLGVLSLLLLLVQVILVGLSFHCEYPLRPPIQQPPELGTLLLGTGGFWAVG